MSSTWKCPFSKEMPNGYGSKWPEVLVIRQPYAPAAFNHHKRSLVLICVRGLVDPQAHSEAGSFNSMVPKVWSLDDQGSATSSQGNQAYISVMPTLKFTYFFN